jgi:hypothetical protein
MDNNQQNIGLIESQESESFDYAFDFTRSANDSEPIVKHSPFSIESEKTCNRCLQKIHKDAKICFHCNSYQKGWIQYFKPYENFIAIFVSGLIAACAIYFSSYYSNQQIELAKKETVKAEEAKRKAEEASMIASGASKISLSASSKALDAQRKAEFSLVNAQNTLKRVNLIKDDLEKQRIFNLNLMSLNEQYAFIFFTDSLLNYVPIENYFNPITDIYSIYGKSNIFSQSYYGSDYRNKNDKLRYFSDLMEISFIRWYSKYFMDTWYVFSRNKGINSGGIGGNTYPNEQISGQNLLSYFIDNKILINTDETYKMTIPPQVNIKRTRNIIGKNRLIYSNITFKHALFEVNVDMQMSLPDELHISIMEQLNISNKLRPPKMKLGSCSISYQVRLEKNFVFNEENSRYYHWIKDLNEGIKSSFDWHNLKN